MTSRRSLLRPLLAAALMLAVAACGPVTSSPGTTTVPVGTEPATTGLAASPAASGAAATQSGDGSYAEFSPDPALLARALVEGGVTTIALPRTLCNYGEVIDAFQERTGLRVHELLPEASAAEQFAAISATSGDPGADAPDVIEVELSLGADAKRQDLIQPYKVATWDSIPASAKDPDGYWYGDYYGVPSFEVNTDVATNLPLDWPDLLRDGYEAHVALAGDPQASNEAMFAVYAAALANGGTPNDAAAGLEFFRELNVAGNFMPVIGKTGTVAGGETPIRLAWTYNALTDRDDLDGIATIEVVVPTSGRIAGVFVQAISKYAPHPNAAKLWMEFLLSDEGQNLRLKGYCHPIRYADLTVSNRIPSDQLTRMPDVAGAVFPTLEQISDAQILIRSKWEEIVGADIICSLDCE